MQLWQLPQQQQQQRHYCQNAQHQKEQQQQAGPKNQKRSLYVENFHISVTENYKWAFFGFQSTKYFQEKVALPLYKETWQI